jgi:large subunit ribosomal protein L29
MSRAPHKRKKREAYRAERRIPGPAVKPGKGRGAAREAVSDNIRSELLRRKVVGRAMREFDALSDGELKTRLADARKELFLLRFRGATGQLEDTSQSGKLHRRIARILTLIRQKETASRVSFSPAPVAD